MTELLGGILAALWLGILTSIAPCPLATNIAAISYIGRQVEKTRLVLLTGLLYTLGRTLVYLLLGLLLTGGLLLIPAVSNNLQHYGHLALGPVMVLVGMFLTGLLGFHSVGTGISEDLQKRVDRSGIWGGLLLGIVFALAFCPTSAALFFGALITLALEHRSPVLLPLLYGIGTALPVVVFAVVIAVSAQYVGKLFNALKNFEVWARLATGTLFILVGIFFCLRYIFEVV